MFLGSMWPSPVPSGHATARSHRRGIPWPGHLAGAVAASKNGPDAEPFPVPDPRATYLPVANPEPNIVTNPPPNRAADPGAGRSYGVQPL